MPSADPYGPLQPDPGGLLDLPKGFSYRVISRLGDAMNDGGRVPEPAGACFSPDGKVLLVNLYSPTATFAIAGPWAHLKA